MRVNPDSLDHGLGAEYGRAPAVREIRERFEALCRAHDTRAQHIYRIRCDAFPQACRRMRRFEGQRDWMQLQLYRMERPARRAEPMHVEALRVDWRRVREADEAVRDVLERAAM